jgi:PAS domain S-box-containing protein
MTKSDEAAGLLAATPADLESLINALPDGVLVVGHEETIVIANTRLEELSGFHREQLLGSPVGDLLFAGDEDRYSDGADGTQTRTVIEAIVSGSSVFLRRQDGSHVDVDVQLGSMSLAGQSFSVASIRETALLEGGSYANRHNEKRYRHLLETVPVVIATLTPNGVITSTNREFEHLTGHSKDEALGKHFSELIDPADLALGLDRFQRVLKGETIGANEVRILTAAGESRVLESVSIPLIEDGQILEVISVGRDVTELRTTEAALRQSERQFRRIFEDSAVGIVLIDADLQIIDINPAMPNMLGWPREEVIGRSVLDFVSPEDADDIRQLKEDVLLDRIQIVQRERRIISSSGETVFTNINSSIVHDDDGVPLAGLIMIADVTERHALQDELTSVADLARESLSVLTPREIDTLNLLAAGRKTADIADQLVVSIRTVESHLASAYRKLGVNRKEDAIERYLHLTTITNSNSL